jgi:hypothetical protein
MVTVVQADTFPAILYVLELWIQYLYLYVRQEQRVYEIFIFLTPLFSAYLPVLL